jgi:hypothetical protein
MHLSLLFTARWEHDHDLFTWGISLRQTWDALLLWAAQSMPFVFDFSEGELRWLIHEARREIEQSNESDMCKRVRRHRLYMERCRISAECCELLADAAMWREVTPPAGAGNSAEKAREALAFPVPPLGNDHVTILRYLAKQRILRTITVIAGECGIKERATVGRLLSDLERENYAERPKGKNKGARITPDGIKFLESLAAIGPTIKTPSKVPT